MMTEDQLREQITKVSADRDRMQRELRELRERLPVLERELIACSGILSGLRVALGVEKPSESG